MALSYEEIKQQVKDGTYVTKSAQADSKYEAIKQKVKSGYYDFGVDDNFINSYLTSSRNYSQKVVNSYKDVTYSSITSRYENEDAERTKVLRDGDKIQAYLNANKANISEENYNNLSQYIKTNREFLANDGVNLKRFYDQTRGKTADEYNLGLVYGDYGESSYDEIKKAEASATNPEIKTALNTLKLIKISTSTAECNAAIEDVKNQIANCNNEEQKKQLESQLSEYTGMLKGAKAYEAVAEYNSVTQQSDFAEYSQAGAKNYTIDTSGTLADIAKSYEEERKKEGFNNQNLVAAFWNILDKYPELAKSDVDIYDIDSNIAPGSFKNFDGFIKAMRGDIGSGGYGGYTFMMENGEVEYAVIGEMDKTERSVYNYLFAKNGVSNADDYLTKLSSCFYDNNLNYRRGKTLYSEIEKGSLEETLYSIKSSLQSSNDNISAVLGGYDDGEYVTISPRQYAQGMINENLTGIRRFISDLAGTIAYMVPSIMSSMVATALTGSDQVGSAVGAAVIGLSSSGGAYNEARQLGYSHKEARTYAALTGATEAGLQYVLGGISKLGGKLTGSGITKLASKFDGAFAKFAINLGGKMASEGLEEYLQEVISPVIKNYAFSTDEEIDLLSSDALYAALLGAVSAGLLESVNAYRSSKAEIAFKELIDMGKNASPDSEAYKLANELSDKPFSKIKPEQINQLSEAVAVEANNNRHKKAAEIESQLVEKGETGDTERIAWAAVNLLSGAKISEVEQNLIKNSPAAKSIISEITGFPIGADADVNIESSTAPRKPKKSNVSVDIKDENGYNSERGENYAATDEFRRLQEESKGESLGDSGRENHASNNEGLRGRLSAIFKGQLERCGINPGTNKLLRLTYDKHNTQFNIYEGINGKLFHDVFEIARKYLKNGELVDLHGIETTEDGIGYNDCYNYLSEDGLSGFSITPDGDLISVFNASGKKGFLYSIAPIVKEKAKTLDCYASEKQNLQEIYQKVFGFKTASVMDYNMEYDHDNIAENHGSPQVAFMVNTDAEVETKHFTKDQYDEAKEYRDGFVKSESADSSESASFMPETKSVLPDVSAADGETDSYEAFTKRYNGTLELTEDQRTIQSICKALGTEAVFENLDRWVTGKDGKRRFFSPDGYFDKATGKIYINTSTNGKHNPLLFVIKHELTHFGEINKNAYDSFVKAVKESKEFKAWLEHKTGMKGETVDIMAAKLGADIRDERSRYDVELGVAESEQEVIANFAGDILFAKSGKTLDSLLNSVEAKQRPKVIQAVVDFFRWLREKLSGNKDLTLKLQRLESKYTDMLKGAQKAAENTNSTGEGGKEYSIESLADGRKYVRADRQVIHGDDVSKWGAQVTNYINRTIRAGKDVTVYGADGDALTITRDTAGKAQFRNYITQSDGTRRLMTDEEYAVKLRAESHIDELSEVSRHGKKDVPDSKNHSFAKDGFNYRTAYFMDNDGKYYRITLSVGKNGEINTVYNVGKIKETERPLVAQRPNRIVSTEDEFNSVSNNRVAQNEPSVNSNSMQETREYSISEEVDTEQDTDYTAEFDKITEQFEKGDITRAEFIEQVKQLYTEAGETYGTIPKGETVTGNENFDNPTPKQVNSKTKVRQFARTIIEGGGLTEEMLSVTKQQILSGELSYTPTSNERNMAAANREIEGGHADELWMKTVACEEAPNSTTIATGEALAKLAFDRKDTVKAVQLVAELCEVGTRTAQALQAFSLLKRMGGIGQLYYVQKAVNTLNHDLKTRFKDKAPDIKINETLAEQLAESKTEEDFAISYTAIMNDISAQVPSTFLDKWNAWRYMAMLANPTTHIRNINGNLMFYPFVKTKDVIASGLEHIFLRGDNADKRTKSVIISKDYKQFAKNDFRNVEEIITGSGKMNPKRGIADNRPIFKTKVLESIRKFNFDLLEKEDAIFLKKHYTRALGGYLQAQNIDLKHVSSDILAKAREYAILEAQKATFRDLNKIANAISRFSNSHLLLNPFVEGVLPFKKTPLNIVKRGIEYSPLGLIKALTKGSYDLKKGNISASQFIDGIAGGLTGTGIMLVGMLLSSLGIVKGGFGDDEEDGYNRLMGEQEYSVELFGISYTIDWAAPACIPFFMGVAINESMESEGNYNWKANLGKTALAGLEPIINLSMLSGIQETIASARYADGKEIVLSVFGNVIGSYFSQALPTIGGKIANTIDDTRRTNYIDKSSNMPIWVQSAINTVKAKVPGLSMTRPEYVDAWGETQDNGNLALRIFQNFLSPGYVSSVEVTDIDNELKRLAGETGEQSVFPDRADKKFKFKNYTKYLSADEYVEYATMKGQMSADYINELIHSDGYSSLTDEQKVEVINNLYALANAKAKSRLSYTYDEINAMHDGKITEEMYNKYNDSTKRAVAEMHFLEDYKKPINMENNGYSAVDYYISQAKIKKKK